MRWVHGLEILNESFLIVATYFMFCFSEYIFDIQLRYQMGNIFIDLLFIVIILNQVGICLEAGVAVNQRRKQ